MRQILIDTNIYIEAMRGNPNVTRELQRVDLIGINSISMGELLAGFKLTQKGKRQISEFEMFLDSPRVELYSVTHATADFYSEIFVKLRSAGTPIPTNDIWIAATAFEHGLLLFTMDKRFKKIPGLNFF